MSQTDTLQNRPTDLGCFDIDMDIEYDDTSPMNNDSRTPSPKPSSSKSSSLLDQQLSKMQDTRTPNIDLLFNGIPEDIREITSDPTHNRKRINDDMFISDTKKFKLQQEQQQQQQQQNERRRGRPRKEEISENEDLRTVAKRMYARAYRENMKTKYIETEEELNELKTKYAELKIKHEKLEKLVEQCNFCTSSWALVKSMNIDPAVLRMAYDTLSNIRKTPSPICHRSNN